jgi:hypothetical protein
MAVATRPKGLRIRHQHYLGTKHNVSLFREGGNPGRPQNSPETGKNGGTGRAVSSRTAWSGTGVCAARGRPQGSEPLPCPYDDSPQRQPPCNLEEDPSSSRCILSSPGSAVCLAHLLPTYTSAFCLLRFAFCLASKPFALRLERRLASFTSVRFQPSHTNHRQVSFSRDAVISAEKQRRKEWFVASGASSTST